MTYKILGVIFHFALMLQNDEWKVVQDNFELTKTGELSLNGFLQLHLMEAEDNCGKSHFNKSSFQEEYFELSKCIAEY